MRPLLKSQIPQDFPQIDYYRNPLLARDSFLQLTLRPWLMGFSNLVWTSGDWRSLASPFCRIEDEEVLDTLCGPEYVVQSSKHALLTAAFVGPDELLIEINASRALTLYSGVPGVIHHNGGTAQQQWMAFDPLREGAAIEQTGPRSLRLVNRRFHAALLASAPITMANEGNGWSLPLAAGYTRLIVVLRLDVEEASQRCRQIAEEILAHPGAEGAAAPILDRLNQEWRYLFASAPKPDGLKPAEIRCMNNAIWCLHTNTVRKVDKLTERMVMGAKIQYPGFFPWDSAFVSVGLGPMDPALALGQIRGFLNSFMKADGEVPTTNAHGWTGGPQFPLFSWALLKLASLPHFDPSAVEELYPSLCRHADWWWRHGDAEGIPILKEVICLDDSPRFDCFAGSHRMSLSEPVYSPDLIAICVLDRLCLSALAIRLGLRAEADAHRLLAAKFAAFADKHLFDSALGYYIDLGRNSGRVSRVQTPFAYWPILWNRSPNFLRSASLALSPGGPFWARFGLATVSKHHPSFDPSRVWRGSIWLCTNFLTADFLAIAGLHREAARIAQSSRELVLANDPLPCGCMEYFNFLTGEGSGAHHIPGMSAAPYLSLLWGLQGLGGEDINKALADPVPSGGETFEQLERTSVAIAACCR